MEKNEILQELNELASPLAGLPHGMPYAVPDGYFNNLGQGVFRVVQTSDVPTGYFEGLPAAMLHAAKAVHVFSPVIPAKKAARIIALPVRRWAAAAVLLVSLGTGAALLFSQGQSSNPETAIAALPQEEIAEYAAANLDALDASLAADGALAGTDAAGARQLSNLSETELEAYLAEEGLLF